MSTKSHKKRRVDARSKTNWPTCRSFLRLSAWLVRD